MSKARQRSSECITQFCLVCELDVYFIEDLSVAD